MLTISNFIIQTFWNFSQDFDFFCHKLMTLCQNPDLYLKSQNDSLSYLLINMSIIWDNTPLRWDTSVISYRIMSENLGVLLLKDEKYYALSFRNVTFYIVKKKTFVKQGSCVCLRVRTDLDIQNYWCFILHILFTPSMNANAYILDVDPARIMFPAVENLYGALRNIDRSDIVKSLEDPVPQAIPEAGEEEACRLAERDSTMLSPSVVNGKERLCAVSWFLTIALYTQYSGPWLYSLTKCACVRSESAWAL